MIDVATQAVTKSQVVAIAQASTATPQVNVALVGVHGVLMDLLHHQHQHHRQGLRLQHRQSQLV